MLVAFPDLAVAMADEANTRFFAESLEDNLRGFQRPAEEL